MGWFGCQVCLWLSLDVVLDPAHLSQMLLVIPNLMQGSQHYRDNIADCMETPFSFMALSAPHLRQLLSCFWPWCCRIRVGPIYSIGAFARSNTEQRPGQSTSVASWELLFSFAREAQTPMSDLAWLPEPTCVELFPKLPGTSWRG